ncbi:NTP transferase domain-containing protein [Candidatus Woesearchaeota archaeon]|nr:NTP transferase domain-containing protein [Candidatus Woesearchaeota archaeon]
MKAIMMCAGKSTRTYPLTVETPKPLLNVLEKTIIERNLDQVNGIVDEIIIVVGFMKDKIISYLGHEYKGIRLIYVEQKEQLGTGHALLMCKEVLNNERKFIVMNGDDLYSKEDIKNLCRYDNGALAKNVQTPENFGIYRTDKEKNMIELVEKPKNAIGNLANIGCYLLPSEIFEILEKCEKSERGEIELTSAIRHLEKFKIIEVKDLWIPIVYPWNYLEANIDLLKREKPNIISGDVEDGVTLKGDINIGENSRIMSGAYIEGPVFIGKNCVIGPNAHIRPDTVIMDNCHIGGEVYDCVFMKNSKAKHHCYIGHSVIGEDVNIGAGTITADYRHDGNSHKTIVRGIKVDSGRRKLGAFLGNMVHTGIATLIYPGRKIWPGLSTIPGEIVDKDKQDK